MNLFRDISPERRYLFFCARNAGVFVCLLHNRMPMCFICNESIYLCIDRNFYLHYLEKDLQTVAYK